MVRRSTPFRPQRLHVAAWIVLALLLALSFGLDLRNAMQGGAIDLRNRVTGARLLLARVDPYFYKWQEPEPPIWCDPYNNPLVPVSKTTSTPALLLLHAPLAALPYRAAQFLWLALQWLLLLGTAWLWLRRGAPGWRRLLLGAFVTGFTYTAAWRLHAERGQSYVLLLFLFAVWLAGTLAAKPGRSFALGMLAGILVTLRPPFVFLAPFLLLHRRAQLPGAVLGLLLGFVLPLFWRADGWTKYAAAMDLHSWLYRSDLSPHFPPEHFPPAIEGMPTDLLANYVAIPYAQFSVHSLLFRFRLEPFPEWPLLLAVGAAYAFWLWWSRRWETDRLLLGLAAWFFLLDLFLPAYRNSYNDVLILNVVGLAVLLPGRVPWGLWACFLGVAAGWAIAFFEPEHDWLIDLPAFCFTLGAVALLFWFNSSDNRSKVDAAC